MTLEARIEHAANLVYADYRNERIQPDTLGHAIAAAVMGLLRQGPTMNVSIAYKTEGLVLVNDDTGEWVTAPNGFKEYDRVALVLLEEEA